MLPDPHRYYVFTHMDVNTIAPFTLIIPPLSHFIDEGLEMTRYECIDKEQKLFAK